MSSPSSKLDRNASPLKRPRCSSVKCLEGVKCVRTRESHFLEFDHPHLNALLKELNGSCCIPKNHHARFNPISSKTLTQQLEIVQKIHYGVLMDEDSSRSKRPSTAAGVEKLLDEAERLIRKRADERKSINCTFAGQCFRRHPEHFKEYKHPHLSEILETIGNEPINEDTLKKFQIPAGVSYDTLKNQLIIVRQLEGGSKPPPANPTSSGDSTKSSLYGAVQVIAETPSTSTMPGTHAVSQAARDKNRAALEKERVIVMDRVRNSINSKLEAAAPYNFFLTCVTESKPTQHEKLSVSFVELIDPMLGDLESVLQLNFMVQLGWLLAQFHIVGLRQIPMTLLYGEIDTDVPSQLSSFITSRRIKPPSPFGSHHTKLMIFTYKDGSLRVVVSTANLVEADWDNRTQGLWISPRCPALPEDADTLSGESSTRFKMCLTRYLAAYKVPELVPWMKKISRVDMTAIRVFFVGSVPGSHSGQALKQWGLGALASTLSENVVVPEKNKYPVVIQCSSIGSLGPNPDAYLTSDVLRTLCSGKKEGVVERPDIKFIYPSFEDVAGSYDGLLGGGCLPYSRKTHDKQPWLTSFMCRWRSNKRHRTRAPPHIKTYCRVSPDNKKLSYFVLTSANLSKAAWGSYNKSGNLSILSYEAGVVFIPRYFFMNDHFNLTEDGDAPPFPLPYDLPVEPYSFSDTPWFFDNLS